MKNYHKLSLFLDEVSKVKNPKIILKFLLDFFKCESALFFILQNKYALLKSTAGKIKYNIKNNSFKLNIHTKPIICNDFKTNIKHNFSFLENFDYEVKNILSVPIKKENQIIGMLKLLNKKDEFIETDKVIIQMFSFIFSDLIKITINNNYNTHITFNDIQYKSNRMQEVIELAKKAAKSDISILIYGESGTGKELLASAIHNYSNRYYAPFIPVLCSALPENLIESELFGYEKGAFTGASSVKIGKFESANNGTVFLDEIAEIPFTTQNKILRFLQDNKIWPLGGNKFKELNIRIIAATNKNLTELIKNKQFRDDLFFRLNTLTLTIPPLRERPEDIDLLIKIFLKKYNTIYKKNIKINSKTIFNDLKNYSWPGNIRELEHFIERLVLLANKEIIDVNEINSIFSMNKKNKNQINNFNYNQNYKVAVDDFRKKFIEFHLQENNFNISQTAEKIKVQRSYLSKFIHKNKLKI